MAGVLFFDRTVHRGCSKCTLHIHGSEPSCDRNILHRHLWSNRDRRALQRGDVHNPVERRAVS